MFSKVTVNKNLCILWVLIVAINIYCCELVVGGAHSRAPWVIMWPFVHPPPTCKPMSNVTFTTWVHPYGELTDVKIRHLLTYHMTLLRGYFVHTARQCKMSCLPTEIVHLAIYMRLLWAHFSTHHPDECSPVTVTWDTKTLLECTRCSKARNATQTHH